MSTGSDFTIRDEANAITACAFRNGFLEDLHAGEYSKLLESNKYSRITDEEMKKLMVESSKQVEDLLRMKETDPKEYDEFIRRYNRMYCTRWER